MASRRCTENRFVAQLGAALEIAGDAPVRIGELLVLRIGNLLDEGSHLVVEIARELRDGREKSREGRRRVMICDITAIAIVRTWLARRAAEALPPMKTIFLESQIDRRNSAHSGRMFWLNRLLKTVPPGIEHQLACLPPRLCQPAPGHYAAAGQRR